ncbi:hypothetical protein [Treponema sp.]|uniref:hypothetical protein n=1 Tax=Treponema sp. TaxID=166 RepID=UPI00298E61FD|nr:hypothetical protein [Treponema sp.]
MKKIITLLTLMSIFTLVSCVSGAQESEEPKTSAPTVTVQKTEAQLEYERAIENINGTQISMETYEMDKKIILQKIAELNTIMKDKNYKSWLNYIEQSSINFWSMKSNLSTVSKQLPVKGLNLKTLEDYFKYVFIPSRMGRRIDEIRYISSTSIKAVQVRNDETIVYYNFKKIDDDWLVELPRL